MNQLRLITLLVSVLYSITCLPQSIIIDNNARVSIASDTHFVIPGDWLNNGNDNITQNGDSWVRFNGTTKQIIRTGNNSFNKIRFDNESSLNDAITLESNITISGEADFIDGIVRVPDGLEFIFGANATTNDGTATSFVDGLVRKVDCSLDGFNFPTGHVINRDLDLLNDPQDYVIWAPFSATPTSQTDVTVRYFFSNDGLNTWWYHDWTHEEPLTHTTDREYWLVNSGADLNNVTLYWNNNDPCEIHDFCNPGFLSQYLTIAYWDDIWKQAGNDINQVSVNGSAEQGSVRAGLTIPFNSKGGTQITFGGKDTDIPLPVELIHFSAKCDNSKVNLLWRTASETNNEGFIIERSHDLIVFEEIGFVEGQGFSNLINTYVFTDKNPSNLNTYYRLKQIDFDGAYEYSHLISINCEYDESDVEPTFSVFPNPTRDFINITAENMPDSEVTIELYNMLGSLLYAVKVQADSSIIIEEIDLSTYPSAMYMLRIISGDFTGMAKIEKQ